MPDINILLTYLAVLAGFVFFPGPSILMTLARATTSGTRAGFATSLGIALGDVIHTLFAVIGVSAMIMASANAFLVIKLLGAGYLIYIGLRSIFDSTSGLAVPKLSPISASKAFRQACVAEVLNPKSAMFFLAFLPQFVVPEQGHVASQLLVFGILFVLAGTFATMLAAIGAGTIGRFLRRKPQIQKWQGKVIGTLYCGLGIRLALQQK
jgi:threonine/homoserine/homoserine lactone efflux protein